MVVKEEIKWVATSLIESSFLPYVYNCLDGANGSHAPLDISNYYGWFWDEIFDFDRFRVSRIIWNFNTNLNAQYIFVYLFSSLCFASLRFLIDWFVYSAWAIISFISKQIQNAHFLLSWTITFGSM